MEAIGTVLQTTGSVITKQFKVTQTCPDGSYQRTRGMSGTSWLGGCGLGFMQSFNYAEFGSFAEQAEFMAALYRELNGPGHVIYCITTGQQSYPVHRALLDMGSREIATFPNLCHVSQPQHLFLVNIREAVNRWCDAVGTPYTEPREYVPYPWPAHREQQSRLERVKV